MLLGKFIIKGTVKWSMLAWCHSCFPLRSHVGVKLQGDCKRHCSLGKGLHYPLILTVYRSPMRMASHVLCEGLSCHVCIQILGTLFKKLFTWWWQYLETLWLADTFAVHSTRVKIFHFLKNLFILVGKGRGIRRESQVNSPLSAEPDMELRTWPELKPRVGCSAY